jgi:Uma2 family endonuclease
MVSLPPALPPSTLRRITVDEYERIIASGSLNEPKKLELIDGYMVTKMGKSAEHVWTTKAVDKALERRLPQGWTSWREQPVRIPAYDEPEPDVTIVRGSDDDYMHRIPEPADIGLLIEVAATAPSEDRKQGDVFARSGIPVLWIINLAAEIPRVEVYTNPSPTGYGNRQDFKSGEEVPVVLDGRRVGQIPVDAILPRELGKDEGKGA